MIIERLEQELAQARERVDRTTRMVRSNRDPALVHARKIADMLAGAHGPNRRRPCRGRRRVPDDCSISRPCRPQPHRPRNPKVRPSASPDGLRSSTSTSVTLWTRAINARSTVTRSRLPKNPSIPPPARHTTNTHWRRLPKNCNGPAGCSKKDTSAKPSMTSTESSTNLSKLASKPTSSAHRKELTGQNGCTRRAICRMNSSTRKSSNTTTP